MSRPQIVIDKLLELHQLEVDANNAYETAIEQFRENELKTTFSRFKKDHDQHLNEIELLLTKRGEKVPSREKGLKGYLIDGMTRLRSSISDEQALKAMRQNEETVFNAYERIYREIHAQNPDVDNLIQSALNDEVKHYNYILSRLGETSGYKDNINFSDLLTNGTSSANSTHILNARDRSQQQPNNKPSSLNEPIDYRNLH